MNTRQAWDLYEKVHTAVHEFQDDDGNLADEHGFRDYVYEHARSMYPDATVEDVQVVTDSVVSKVLG